MEKLTPDFYLSDTVSVARSLLGKVLVHRLPEGEVSCLITETEAYCGPNDKACHSYAKRAPNGRTSVMYHQGGCAYVYLIYGMYYCFNVVTRPKGDPQAVLIRSAEPIEGTEWMTARRTRVGKQPPLHKNLLTGPGKLCQAMGITIAAYGEPLWGETLFLTEGREIAPEDIITGCRINVSYAQEDALLPYRFGIRDSAFLSAKF